jgi:hypothetical protein
MAETAWPGCEIVRERFLTSPEIWLGGAWRDVVIY